jgi:hypothetical protein
MSTFLAALAGGAIGVLLTWAARLTTVGREILAHDRAIRRWETHLETWVSDETVRLRRALTATRDELNAKGLFNSGEHSYQVALVKEQALQAYRDQERTAQSHVEDIVAAEGPAHAFLRRWRYKDLRVDLATSATVRDILDYWARPATRHLSPGDEPAPIDDPRTRTIDRTLREIKPTDWE